MGAKKGKGEKEDKRGKAGKEDLRKTVKEEQAENGKE